MQQGLASGEKTPSLSFFLQTNSKSVDALRGAERDGRGIIINRCADVIFTTYDSIFKPLHSPLIDSFALSVRRRGSGHAFLAPVAGRLDDRKFIHCVLPMRAAEYEIDWHRS